MKKKDIYSELNFSKEYQKKLLEFLKNHTTIEFIGKKGVLNKNKVTNSNMCFLLKELCNRH